VNERYYTDLYFESHITIEPVFDEDLEKVRAIAKRHDFRVADLLMKKRAEDTETRSQYDTFCTTRSKFFEDIERRTEGCRRALEHHGFKVWRVKIENTLYDKRYRDRV